MATITLRPEVYDEAAAFAHRDKLDVDEWVNEALQRVFMRHATTEEKVEQPTELKMFSWEEMEGMFASDKSDNELRDDYLEEKYGI